MNKFIKFAALLPVLCLGFSVAACGEQTETPAPMTVTTNDVREGYSPDAVVDGDRSIGWIGNKKATESNFRTLEIDFGQKKSFSKITLDDSFTDGYTNARPQYLPQTVSYNNGNTSSLKEGTALANVLSGGADGRSWQSETPPTEDSPAWVWISLYEPTQATKIELNNEMNNSVFKSFEVYYSETAHNRRKEEEYTDPSTYTLLAKETNGENNITEMKFDEEITVSDLLIFIYAQENEGVPVEASIDEILFYGSAGEDYTEEHYPEQFTIMGSNDGKKYEDIVTVSNNYTSIWEKTLDAPVEYRYIKYIVFHEYNNNYPSIGELIFE